MLLRRASVAFDPDEIGTRSSTVRGVVIGAPPSAIGWASESTGAEEVNPFVYVPISQPMSAAIGPFGVTEFQIRMSKRLAAAQPAKPARMFPIDGMNVAATWFRTTA